LKILPNIECCSNVLCVPIDAARRLLRRDVPAGRRTRTEAPPTLPPRQSAPHLQNRLTMPIPSSTWSADDGLAQSSQQLADAIGDLAAKHAAAQVAAMPVAAPPHQPIPTITVEPFDGDASREGSPPRSHGSGRSHAAKSQGSLSEGDHSQEGSTDTVLRTELSDVLGSDTAIYIKKGGRRRMVSSVDTAHRDAVRSVIEQASQSGEITKLSEPSSTSDGLASFPAVVAGESFTAFISFAADGRVTQVDLSDESLSSRFEARDEGRASTSRRLGDGAASAVPRPATPPPLTPRDGVAARVDVSGRFERSAGTSDGTPGYTYTYDPRPERDHGMLVEATAGGELRLAAIRAKPELSATFGSGTDMMLGLARRLDAEGYRVREITGSWMPEPGVDSQYQRYMQALANDRTVEQAAMDTFFGKVARTFAFTDVLVLQDEDCGIYVKFRRPSP
jgi:hypothetical protein